MNERDNNKNCWVSLFRKNTFEITITERNIKQLTESEWLITGLQYREIREIIRRYEKFYKYRFRDNVNRIEIENIFEKRKKLIFKYFNLSSSRTNLVKIAYKLLGSGKSEF
jgi:hypothetical protein